MIHVLGGPVADQMREVTAGGLYLSHSDYGQSFATGTADSVTIVVDWPDGRRITLPGAKPGREYELSHGGSRRTRWIAILWRGSPPSPRSSRTGAISSDIVTSRISSTTGRASACCPRASPASGPGVTWFDIDRDGDEDLFIGSGRGGKLAWFRNDNGRFTAAPSELAGRAR